MMPRMREAIVSVLSQVFAVPAGTIDDKFSPQTCKKWDSLKHLQLVLALEDRFACTIDPGDIPRLVNPNEIETVLGAMGVAA